MSKHELTIALYDGLPPSNRLSDRVEKLLDGSVLHKAHETYLVDAMAKFRVNVNTVGDLKHTHVIVYSFHSCTKLACRFWSFCDQH
jgi:hypothetical protein